MTSTFYEIQYECKQESSLTGLCLSKNTTVTYARKRSRIMSEVNEQLFVPKTSKNTLANPVKLPNLLGRGDKTTHSRPRSESCLETRRLTHGLPDLYDSDSKCIPPSLKRPKTLPKRPRTSQETATNTKHSTERYSVITPAEISIYKLSKYKKLIKPEIEITNTSCTQPESFSNTSLTNKKLLDEHIERENKGFDKHETKRNELLRWLENSGKE